MMSYKNIPVLPPGLEVCWEDVISNWGPWVGTSQLKLRTQRGGYQVGDAGMVTRGIRKTLGLPTASYWTSSLEASWQGAREVQIPVAQNRAGQRFGGHLRTDRPLPPQMHGLKKAVWFYNSFIICLCFKTNCRNNLCTKFTITKVSRDAS